MKKLNFEVGQLAETKSFVTGYRGAWFRCKIKGIDLSKKKILPEYYDFDPAKLRWSKVYQVSPYSRKSKYSKRHLMVRPEYPIVYQKSEMPHVNMISNACVVINGTWKVGDLVDWFRDGCYWSATIVKILSDNKVQVELPMPPSGEGEEGEEGRYEALCSDFRPSLHWSETEGWTLPTVNGHTACDAQLIFPTNQEDVPPPEPAAAASTTRVSAERDKDSDQKEESVKMSCVVGMDLDPESAPAASGSTARISTEGGRDNGQNEKSLKMDCDLMESSDSIPSLRKTVAEAEVEKRELNIMHDDTLESAIIDLQELVTKVKWMQRLLQSPCNDATPSSWKFA